MTEVDHTVATVDRPIVVVTGSRHRNKPADYDIVRKMILMQTPLMVIAGGARGIDTVARKVCVAHGIWFLEMPALWERQGRRAGPLRNAAMVQVVKWLKGENGENVTVLAFPDKNSVGTLHMMKLCREEGWFVNVEEE